MLVRTACLHKGYTGRLISLDCTVDFGDLTLMEDLNAVRNTLASEADVISSNKESRHCEISGFIDANVWIVIQFHNVI